MAAKKSFILVYKATAKDKKGLDMKEAKQRIVGRASTLHAALLKLAKYPSGVTLFLKEGRDPAKPFKG